MSDDTDQVGLSRRTMIKAAGAGTVLAWGAPAVLTLSGSAHAASVRPNCGTPGVSCFACDLAECGCGGTVGTCDCGCVPTIEDPDSCSCVSFVGNDNPCANHAVCTSSSECDQARGDLCVITCCGDYRCWNPCGTSSQSTSVLSGPMGSPR
jgi:hypothetical protein